MVLRYKLHAQKGHSLIDQSMSIRLSYLICCLTYLPGFFFCILIIKRNKIIKKKKSDNERITYKGKNIAVKGLSIGRLNPIPGRTPILNLKPTSLTQQKNK